MNLSTLVIVFGGIREKGESEIWFPDFSRGYDYQINYPLNLNLNINDTNFQL